MGFIKLKKEEKEKLGAKVTESQEAGFPTHEESLTADIKVFDTPVNEAILVYIPNRTRPSTASDCEEGAIELDTLKAATHGLSGKAFDTVRCLNGIDLGADNEYGLDGTCPYCDNATISHELYTAQLEQAAALKGITDLKSPELESERTALSKQKAVSFSNTREAFPMVLIPSTVKQEKGKRVYYPKLKEDGSLDLEVVVNVISTYRLTEKIVKGLNATEYASPAGLIMLFDFRYDTKGKAATKRDSAKEFTASLFDDPSAPTFKWGKEMGEAIIQIAEELCAPYTKEYLAENLRSFAFTDMPTAVSIAESYIAKTKQSLALRAAAQGAIAQSSTAVATTDSAVTPEDVLSQFKVAN